MDRLAPINPRPVRHFDQEEQDTDNNNDLHTEFPSRLRVRAAPYDTLRRRVFYKGSSLMVTIAEFCATQVKKAVVCFTHEGQSSENV